MLANLITLLRVGSLPLIIYLVNQETAESSLLALIVLGFALFTDVLDGYVARKGDITKIGSFLDPFADKLLVMGLLFTFSWRGSFSWIILLLFILRDLIVGSIWWMATRDDILLKEKRYGKTMAYLQVGIISGLLMQTSLLGRDLVNFFSTVALLIAIISIIHYSIVYGRRLRLLRRNGTDVKKGRMIILANRKAGGYPLRYRRHLLRLFSRRRKANIVYLPAKKEMYQGIEKSINGSKAIIIAGGDGSFESAINYKPLQKKALGFFPLGKGNAFYSYFYRGKRFEYLRSRFTFQKHKLDVLEMSWNGRKLQTEFLSIGVDAEIMRLSQDRKKKGFWAYFHASLVGLRKAKASFVLELVVDGKKINWSNCINLTLGKVPFYGFNLRALFDVKPADGKIYGLGYVNKHSPLLNKTLRIWGIILANMGISKSPLVELSAKVIEIKSKKSFPIQAGGEYLGVTNHIRVKVVRQQTVLMI